MALPEIAELDEYRLSHDLTWDQLAVVTAAHGFVLSSRTLYHIVKRGQRPMDRTLYKIRQFLKAAAAREDASREASTVPDSEPAVRAS